jgi:hypothetical protein
MSKTLLTALALALVLAVPAYAGDSGSSVYDSLFHCGKACGGSKDKCGGGCKKACDSCKPKCSPCKPACSPCKPKCEPCKPKCEPCKPKCEPCQPKCCPKVEKNMPCPCSGDAEIGRPGTSRQSA